MASQTGSRGDETSGPMIHPETGTRNSMCIRYIPNVSFAIAVTAEGAFSRSMQENSRKIPKVASTTLGEQNPQLHSISGSETSG